MVDYYGILDKEDELKEWYDGYKFGDEEIYNPWSVINYISKKCVPQAYWVNTGKNEILEDVMEAASEDINEKLFFRALIQTFFDRIDQTYFSKVLLTAPFYFNISFR